MALSTDAIIVISIIILMIVALAKELVRPGMIMFSALTLMMVMGIVSTKESLSGFANTGMITVAVLFIVSEGISHTGALKYLARVLLPKKRKPIHWLYLQIMVPVSVVSAFLNNTPVVVIFAPIIKNWSERLQLPASKFLIPLSYATILGGMTTLIGTSTNLVVHGLMLDNGLEGFNMFELGKVGVPIAVVGMLYIAIFGGLLLPGKRAKFMTKNQFKEYFYDVIIPDKSKLIGQTIAKGYLSEIRSVKVERLVREGVELDVENGFDEIHPGDSLLLRGTSETIYELMQNPAVELKGLDNLAPEMRHKKLKQVEAVLAPRFPGIGKTIGQFDFYSHYQAAIMAINRNGEHITDDFDNIVLKEGDTLILLTTEHFIKAWSESKIFYLTSYLGDVNNGKNPVKKWIAGGIVLLMVAGATIGDFLPPVGPNKMNMYWFASLAAILMVWLNIVPHQRYTKVISWDVLITIAASLGISKAMQNSGAADMIATTAINFSKQHGPIVVLMTIYLLTNLFTEVITNNAAAALVFPIAMSAAHQMGVDPKPFFVAICIAASASFTTPIGYQTNLIVQSIGNYKFKDFVKIGLILNVIAFIMSMVLIPLIWEF
ncbi:di/tricarboxylate transporter [Breznakibacter xylanolyticus]|uniref:Di/tricarboxylate transporter n=1 Tax=Breznakibacter xylanolyticus TaxID=990 RepID=A0A2W7MXP8_9BACT|nr:SLC13 family permease [Breznakibacter xylanolyticus]PZX12768.1 di/tricarboxylate transporter [Breznakibacter xylanolyticus]